MEHNLHLDAIRSFMYDHQLNQEEMAKRLDVTPATLSNWLSGVHGLTKKSQLKVEHVCAEAIHRPHGNAQVISIHELKPVRVYSIAQAAQVATKPFGDAAADFDDEETVNFIDPSPEDFAIRVSGDSMMPWYPSGTRVLVGRGDKPRTGDRVIANIADFEEPVFKVYVDLGGEFALLSINKDGGIAPLRFDKMDKGESWYWVYPIKESVRNERSVDDAMSKSGIHHFWEKWLEDEMKTRRAQK